MGDLGVQKTDKQIHRPVGDVGSKGQTTAPSAIPARKHTAHSGVLLHSRTILSPFFTPSFARPLATFLVVLSISSNLNDFPVNPSI